jgi:hypothetical protein
MYNYVFFPVVESGTLPKIRAFWSQPEMTYSEHGYRFRAEECVRLANATEDEMLRGAILGLRQQYLKIAKRLGEMDRPALQSGTAKPTSNDA